MKQMDAPGAVATLRSWFRNTIRSNAIGSMFIASFCTSYLWANPGEQPANTESAGENAPKVTSEEQPNATSGGLSELYSTKLKPMFRERCFGCHGGLKQEGNLRLDTVEFMLQGGDSGPAINRELAFDQNLLYERLSSQDDSYRMPPPHEGEAFTTEQLALLQTWLEAKAPGLENETAEKSPEEHWSFRPLSKPIPPSASSLDASANTENGKGDHSWARNPIDQWIAKGHEQEGLKPVPEANRALLLRRLTLDLIGLLPTPKEIEEFENDTDPDWYEKAVERLLDDPRHGERWARHWMDNWRYSDWWGLGNELRNSQRTIWHWRDWIVESLNEDKPYDQMVRSMLAADELSPKDASEIRATGFLARNYYIFNRHRWMDETVEHVSKAFLGLTMNCAKCHDHKFDPISQEDYYKMRAFFEPYHVRNDMVPGTLDITNRGIPRVFDAELDTPTYIFIRGEESKPDTTKPIQPGLPELLAKSPLNIEEVDLPPEAYELQRQSWVTDAYRAEAVAGVTKLEDELAKATAAATTELAKFEAIRSGTSDVTEQNVTPEFTETFQKLDQSLWEQHGGEWKVTDLGLEQNSAGSDRPHLKYLGNIPTDFEATLTYQLRGGNQWKSVGITFDANQNSEVTVYASGVNPGSKVQASYKSAGQSHFPGEGAKAHGVPQDTDITLKVLVRDRLINVFFNDERVIAWRSPLERTSGDFQIFNFDAVSTLKKFRLAPLSVDQELYDPETKDVSTGNLMAEAERKYRRVQRTADIAAKKLELQHAIVASIDARIAAFQAKWQNPNSDLAKSTHRDAVKAERYVNLINSKLGVFLATPGLIASTSAKAAASEEEKALATSNLSPEEKKKLDEAIVKLEKDQAAYDAEVSPMDNITPFVATKWSVTRFKFTGSDDPAVSIPSKSTGRRKALAEWITSPDNPLTARVAVNHLWTRHMDQPLAANTFDFGRNSPDPLHPELLDWLASELIENNWSMKHIHRLIVQSATYRMSSSGAEHKEQLAKDPDNKYWWKRNPIRLESQVIRDSILELAGRIDPTVGGPPVTPDKQDKSLRRSLYFFHSNNDRNQFLTTFDEATVSECYRREQSIVPQQALALSNSALVLDNIDSISKRIYDLTSGQAHDFVQKAFLCILGQNASDEERRLAEQALQKWRQLPNMSEERARSLLVLALLNHNDFVTLR